MTGNALVQLALFGAVLIGLGLPLGSYLARVLSGERTLLAPITTPIEKLLLRIAHVEPDDEMTWQRYATALLLFSGAGLIAVFLLQVMQAKLPLNPDQLPGVGAALSFNTAISFVTNTNWQSYAGESTLSYLVQMVGLGVQNFVSAAAGIAVMAALLRGFARHSSSTIGNFWADLVRVTVHVLLPLSVVLAVLLASQGVVQSFRGAVAATTLADSAHGIQHIALGPVASQEAIKQLGTNGGGFFNVNSAHPFENPTPLSNFLEVVAILLIPVACCFTFGRMVRDRRQGWALFTAMAILLAGAIVVTLTAEQRGTPALAAAGATRLADAGQPGGNMEGKEVRFGITNSALWAVATTAASNGSVNAMHDSFTPVGGLAPLVLIQLGEVVFGGVGSGLYGMLLFALVTVFVAGLMVGRTPEYLGKKIEAFEMKMVMVAILVPALAVLAGTALGSALPAGRAGIFNSGAHGFSEVLYAFSSASNNNGSAFAGLSANTTFYNLLLGLAMFAGRFLVAIPVLATAGSLAGKKLVPASAGTLPTHGPLFVAMLLATIVLVGALTFVPALALGPIVEQIQLVGQGVIR